jgi:predicted metalloprotease
MMKHSKFWGTVAALTAFCAAAAVGPAQADAASPAQAEVRATATESPGDYMTETEQAVAAVDTWWRTHWSEYFTGSYTPPTIGGFYDSSNPADPTTCNGTKPSPRNAFYCPMEDKVIWDQVLFAQEYQKDDASVWGIVAHEFGHAIQARLDVSLRMQGLELQADCFAGAVLAGAQADGLLVLEPGDNKALGELLARVAEDTPYDSSDDHGDAFERIGWFHHGRVAGIGGCLPIAQGPSPSQ